VVAGALAEHHKKASLEMLNVAIIALAMAAAAGPIHTPGFSHGGQRSLATPLTYPQGRADSVHRPGFNGRIWIGSITVGPQDGHYASGANDPGAAAYGGVDVDQRVLARIGTEVVGFSPWTSFSGNGLHRYETARQEWLKEQGYVGGVRTFVNDLYLEKVEHFAQADEPAAGGRHKIEPRAIIQVAPEVTRLRKRMHVRVVSPSQPLARSADVAVRVVEMSGQPTEALAAK
jgi:hypothetical protein